jgi:hypothetical protein
MKTRSPRAATWIPEVHFAKRQLALAVVALCAVWAAGAAQVATAAETTLDEAAIDRRPEIRAHLGGPDAFVLTVDEVDGELVRFESWMYYETATQFDLAGGELLWSVDLDVLPDGSLYPLGYDPDMFEMLASTAEVRALLPDVELTEVPLKDKAIPGGLFLAGEQLLLAFVDDKLIYAESFALVPEGS